MVKQGLNEAPHVVLTTVLDPGTKQESAFLPRGACRLGVGGGLHSFPLQQSPHHYTQEESLGSGVVTGEMQTQAAGEGPDGLSCPDPEVRWHMQDPL